MFSGRKKLMDVWSNNVATLFSSEIGTILENMEVFTKLFIEQFDVT